MSARDAQNVVVTGGVVGNLATTSYGPRTTNKTTGSTRPMSWSKRQLVLQLDGDQSPTLTADFRNQNLGIIPKGSFITSVTAYSETGAVISLVPTDSLANTATAIPLTPAAGAWDTATAAISTLADTQIAGTIAAGDTATVVVEFLQTESPANGGVLAKPTAGTTSASL